MLDLQSRAVKRKDVKDKLFTKQNDMVKKTLLRICHPQLHPPGFPNPVPQENMIEQTL